jgi:UPF0755 protein
MLVAIAGTLGLAALLLLAWGAFARPGEGRSVRLEWVAEPNAAAAAARLHDRGLTRRPLLLTLYLQLFADPADFQAGPHLLNDGSSARDLVRHLRRSALRGTVKLTIPEGFNHLQIAERLEEQGVTPADTFRAAVRDRSLLGALQIPGESAEGYLFPSTYDMPRDSDASTVVRGMVAEFRRRFQKLGEAQATAFETLKRERGLDAHGVVVLASIVEKEARLAEDRPLIASVYLNRLSDPDFKPLRMLQADPTAGYGSSATPPRAAPATTAR